MKKTILGLVLMLVSVVTFAQQPVITFAEKEHDFGKIAEDGGKVTHVFEFKNEGQEPLVISNVKASCGCTTPTWTRTPIEPGKTGNITVTYNPSGRPGRFQKSITITSNATTPTTKLYIKGEVIPKNAEPADMYPVAMGDLRLESKTINYNNVLNDQNVTRSIEYANLTDHDITVEVVQNSKDDFITTVNTLTTLKPNETGQLKVNFNAATCDEFGTVRRDLYVVVNGKRTLTDEYKISLQATVVENFSHLTPEERQQAPIFEFDNRKIDFGVVKAEEKHSKQLELKNVGVNPLLIHKVSCRNGGASMTVKAPKSIKGGKTGQLTLDLNTASLNPATYTRQVEIITNDPKRSRVYLTVTWRVE